MAHDGTGIIALDPWLEAYRDGLRMRCAHYERYRKQIDATGGPMGAISQGDSYFGINRGERDGEPGLWYREWAPGADYLALFGDFNEWNRGADALQRDEYGVWSLFLPDWDGRSRLAHESRYKVHVAWPGGARDRIPAYAHRVIQDPWTHDFVAQFWNPDSGYTWRSPLPPAPKAPRIYEAHVGMALEDGRVGTFPEFTHNLLPRIADLGYNYIQLMAVMEHPYYGSFGYHVSNLYAVSSRFGTPDELKELIDAAHSMGILVIMDLIHSHAVKNLNEGLNQFDGTDHQYFHAGARGYHAAWDSLCFDYAKYEVQRLLLSNVRFWLEEYRFDGLRFDGVTSMLYLDHGLGKAFTSYDDYFSPNVDLDAVAYMMLANEVAHASRPEAITISEDVSGMVGMARPVSEGGLGFDYRLAMGVPDYWIKLLKERHDEDWSLAEIYHTLLNRRPHEKHIAYAESHDQALVGDKTIAFWLMDADMYGHMSQSTRNLRIDRGIAMHKLITLITFGLGGEGYLNFMGNEFGHPEWIDFPRVGNDFSYHYARRQWSLVDREDLLYHLLNDFNRAVNRLDIDYGVLSDPFIEQLALHENTKQLVFRRGQLVFAFNFHPQASYSELRIPIPDASDYRLVVNTDAVEFGGHGLVAPGMVYPKQDVPMYGRSQSIQVYLPARSAQALAPA